MRPNDAVRRFHEANPWVYRELVNHARDLVARGHRRLGMRMLYEVVRWHHLRETARDGDFALNDNFISRYARLIQTNEPDLAGVFETRQLKA